MTSDASKTMGIMGDADENVLDFLCLACGRTVLARGGDQHTCSCGAVYELRIVPVQIKDGGDAVNPH